MSGAQFDETAGRRTSMHCSQHACDKFVDAIAFLHKRHQRGNTTLVVGAASKMGENEFLKGVYLILEGHEI